MTDTRDQRPAETTLGFLRSVFPTEWREPPRGQGAVAEWEQKNGVALPEPYRTFIAEVSNGSSLGPASDGGLQPLGWLPDTWPDLGPRQPGHPFPLETAWVWEDDESAGPEDPRINAAFNNGSVVLGSEDGQSFWLLLTTGPHRGEVWMIADVGAVPAPATRHGVSRSGCGVGTPATTGGTDRSDAHGRRPQTVRVPGASQSGDHRLPVRTLCLNFYGTCRLTAPRRVARSGRRERMPRLSGRPGGDAIVGPSRNGVEVQVAYRLFRSWTTRVENIHPSRLQTDAHGSRQTLDQIDRLGEYLGGRVEDVGVMSRRHHQGVPWARGSSGVNAQADGSRAAHCALSSRMSRQKGHDIQAPLPQAGDSKRRGAPGARRHSIVNRVTLRLGPGRGSTAVRAGSPCHASNGKRAPGETKTDTGVRTVVLPAFLHKDLRRHLDWYARRSSSAVAVRHSTGPGGGGLGTCPPRRSATSGTGHLLAPRRR